MSFLIDGPALYLAGRRTAQAVRDPDAAEVVATATVAGFLAVSIPLYLNRPWTRPIWRLCRARSGRDWMINSGVLKVDDAAVGPTGHVMAAAAFVTYPLWMWLGLRHGRR
ncbi:hypothetical protein PAI11_27620 [Patulibacter medicamentivorans]|jgi:hypothetical protein|uniref:Uncharacterized protein n=1 Tax=Patulibacter medicamentivorans TaxID=1097667 RepID=H0E7G0_9ACTN|nr:hypothetical protein [Patulibacter medicamentivorans]EHN10380.1 hypothetical protein PAI11_27620 [Patulibacter medicamentivorans]